jgi:hypothetical protein
MDHSVTRKGGRDGLKTVQIAKSAAKLLYEKKVQRPSF